MASSSQRPGVGQKGSGTGKNSRSWLPKLRGSAGEAKARAAEDAKQRREAEKSPKSVILSKRDIQGEYDAYRALQTTLGGARRNITADDLEAFRQNMRMLQGRINVAGITAQQVLDLAASHPLKNPRNPKDAGDLDRAGKEINFAVPVAAAVPAQASDSLDVRFMTNAGPKSKVTRHHVVVRFHGYGNAARLIMATPTTQQPPKGKLSKVVTPKQAAVQMRAAGLAFDCDCERTRFFLRYLATAGGYNAGRPEHGYPKIRNPGLQGVACKHVLRVMIEIVQSAAVLNFLERVLAKALTSEDNKVRVQSTQAEATAAAERQSKAPRAIETSDERSTRLRRERQRRALLQAMKSEAAQVPHKRIAAGSRAPLQVGSDEIARRAKAIGLSPEALNYLIFGKA